MIYVCTFVPYIRHETYLRNSAQQNLKRYSRNGKNQTQSQNICTCTTIQKYDVSSWKWPNTRSETESSGMIYMFRSRKVWRYQGVIKSRKSKRYRQYNVQRYRQYNAQEKNKKRQTMIHKTLHKRLKVEQRESQSKQGWSHVYWKHTQFLLNFLYQTLVEWS